MANALVEFLQILVSGIVTLAEGIASGVVAMAKALFLVTDAQGAVTGLSIFAQMIALFGGIALATGITYKVYNWVVSLGH